MTTAPRRPWVRLYRDERGSFQQLPLYARALAAEVLKLTDDQGVIQIGNREPADAVAFALGADRSDRRMLRRHIPMLIADGFLRHEQGRLVVQNFRKWQGGYPEEPMPEPDGADLQEHVANDTDATPEPLQNHSNDTPEQRRCNDATTPEPLQDHDATTTESVNPRNHSGPDPNARAIEEIRVEERRGEGSARAREVASSEEPTDFESIQEAFSEFRKRALEVKSDWRASTKTYDHVQNAAEHLRAEADARGESLRDLADRSLRGFELDESAQKKNYPIGFWSHDPVRYLRAVESGKSSVEPDTEAGRIRQELRELGEHMESLGDPEQIREARQRRRALAERLRAVEQGSSVQEAAG